MRNLLLGAALSSLSLSLGVPGFAEAEPRAKRVRTARASTADVRLNRARNVVYVGRRTMWRGGTAHRRVISRVRWSRYRDAVAFATRGRFGDTRLVVVLVGGGADGHVMRFPVPARVRTRAARASVMWLGRRRVGFGRSPLRPDMVASWRVRQ